MQRITIAEIRKDEWFVKDYTPVQVIDYEHVNLDDVYAAFDDPEVGFSRHSSLSPPFVLLVGMCIYSKACVLMVYVTQYVFTSGTKRSTGWNKRHGSTDSKCI